MFKVIINQGHTCSMKLSFENGKDKTRILTLFGIVIEFKNRKNKMFINCVSSTRVNVISCTTLSNGTIYRL